MAGALKERLEGRQVDDGWIGFDLAEVGVHRRVDRDVGRDAVLDIGAAVYCWSRSNPGTGTFLTTA